MQDLVLVTIIAISVGVCIGWLSFYYLSRLVSRFLLFKKVGIEGIAQEEAERILTKNGFKIIDRQRKAPIITYINGKPNLSFVQADFIVSKMGKTFVAEVKTSEFESGTIDPSLRRRLLEYEFVYRPDGLLIVDLIERRIKNIRFGLPEQDTERFILFVLGLIIISVIAGVIFIYIQAKLF